MMSLDPWRSIVVSPLGDVVVPAPVWGHPFYREIPSWIHYGEGDDTRRLLFDGVFIGAKAPSVDQMRTLEVTAMMRPHAYAGHSFLGPYYTGAEISPAPPQRSGLTAEVAPVVAPATGGITVKKEFDDKQVLHVEICVDGKCYRTSMDLAPAIAMIMAKLARWHESEHAQMAAKASLPVVVGAVDSAVGEAVDGMAAMLVGRHVECVCGSFLDDIGNAVKGAASGIAGGVVSTIKQLKGPIAAAASTAAAGGAAMIPGVGPFAAPIAGKLANDLVNSTIGDTDAQKSVASAKQQAASNPTIAVALDQAQKAVAHATVAHHVHRTAKHAAQGQPQAQQQIAQIIADAQRGDPAAKAVFDLIANVLGTSSWSASAVASGWYDLVGAR